MPGAVPQLSDTLATALEVRTDSAWEQFIRAATPIIASAVCRVSASSGITAKQPEDLVQEAFLKLCGAGFSALGKLRSASNESIAAYLVTVARSVAYDHVRSHVAQKRGSGRAEEPLDGIPAKPKVSDDPFQITERRLLLERIAHCLHGQSQRDRIIFWLYYRQGFTCKAISRLPQFKLTVKGVETAIYRVTTIVRDCLLAGGFGHLPDRKGNAPAMRLES